MVVNLNDPVRFKLTKMGCRLYNNEPDRYPLSVDANGYCEMQLWEFMHTFGKYMSIGLGETITHNNELIFEEGANG